MTTDEKLDRILEGQAELKVEVAGLRVKSEHLEAEVTRLGDSFEAHAQEDQRFFKEMWPGTQVSSERISNNEARLERLEDVQVGPKKQAGIAGGGGVVGAILWALIDWMWRSAGGEG